MAEGFTSAQGALVSPLAKARATPTAGRAAAFIASDYPHLGYLVIRGRAADAAFMDAASAVLGLRLPTTPRTVAACGAGRVLWQSPDEWWLVTARHQRDAVAGALATALKGCFAQLVDNSGGFAALHIRGRNWTTLLRHLSPYDFDSLPIGSCVSTVIGKATFTVIPASAEGVTLIFRRSFADYIWALIDRAALPYGLQLAAPGEVPDGLLSPLLEDAAQPGSRARA